MSQAPTRALVRGIAATLFDAQVAVPAAEPIDVPLAVRQQRAYVEALRQLGLTVEELPADDAFPDCCFVEDCALFLDGVALVTRPGAPSRRGEVQAVHDALAPRARRLETMRAPATLDGGDCLQVGRRIFVGQSARSNAAGLEAVRETFGPEGFEVLPVTVGDVLHLKCVCSPLGGDRVLAAEGTLPEGTFASAQVVWVPHEERYAANCVAVGRRVLLAAGHPRTRAALEREGFEPLELDVSELRKADGSLTCLSVRF